EILSRYPEIRRAREEGRTVAVYAPTFRVGRDISGYIEELSEALDRNGTLLIVKKHPIMEVPDVKGSMIVDTDFSTMEMLCAADVVICDYSAVVFEAALMGKKLLFYAFDLDEYKGRRDFYIDYAAEVPGEICRTGEEAAAVIADDRFDPARVRGFAEKYVTVRHDASKLLAERILEG
ncbi:MAG: CDP-glycerol glycerophosphotransferase family protein, partial [Eubacterium sp.]|nr:CDP-glycerol glycerophosphotransferase family protein [Eubacterium sp.]